MSDFRPAQAGTGWGQAAPATSAFSPFRSRIFLAIWIASLVSNFGSLIQNVGATWLMTSLAPSADMVALVQVSTVLPIMLFSLPAGAAADVWDRRVIMLVAQGTMLVVSAALAVLAWLGQVTPWLLVLLTFLLGMGAALYGPAWQSSVREQVPRPDLPAAVEVAAYRIVTEALTNVARHSNGPSARVRLGCTGRGLSVEVTDVGQSGEWRSGVGLESMRERAAELGGTLEAGPGPGGGRVAALLPL